MHNYMYKGISFTVKEKKTRQLLLMQKHMSPLYIVPRVKYSHEHWLHMTKCWGGGKDEVCWKHEKSVYVKQDIWVALHLNIVNSLCSMIWKSPKGLEGYWVNITIWPLNPRCSLDLEPKSMLYVLCTWSQHSEFF